MKLKAGWQKQTFRLHTNNAQTAKSTWSRNHVTRTSGVLTLTIVASRSVQVYATELCLFVLDRIKRDEIIKKELFYILLHVYCKEKK